jgi:hypothetical protein
MRRILACIFLFASPLLAQARFDPSGAAAAATGPAFEASLGYVYLSMAMPSQRVGFNGVSASGHARFTRRWGATLDSTYAHSSNVLSTGYNGNFLSSLVGPVFYPPVNAKAGIFVRALIGASWVDSAVPVNDTSYRGGWAVHPSYAVGGGFEHSLLGPLTVRAGADYQRTTFVNSIGALQYQNNLRLATSVAYRFRNR